jgi:hypothetical protein
VGSVLIRTSTFSFRSIAVALWSFWRRGRKAERTGYLVGAILATSGLIHLGMLVIDGGSWEGPLSLRKAMTFGLSFGLTLFTIVWVASFLRLSHRSRAALLGAFTVACALETVLVTLQVWRGVPSHFNIGTRFDAMVARMLAAGGFALVAIIGALTFTAFRTNPAVPGSLRVAIRIGFVMLFASLIVGAVMIANGMSMVFAGNPQAAYATGGSLKPTHAVMMHAILVLPLLAWTLSFVDWSERRRLRVVMLCAAGYVSLASLVAAQNFSGHALSDTPFLVIALSAVALLALVSSACLAADGLVRVFTPGGIQHT